MEYDSGRPVFATYQMYPLYRAQLIAVFGILTLFAVVMFASTASTDVRFLLFGLFWLAALGWNAYWWLVRISYRLDLNGDELRWLTPTRSGTIPLHQLRAIRPYRFGRNVTVFEVGDGSSILVLTRRGFTDFTARVQAAAPHVTVRLNWYIRLIDRFSRGSHPTN
jgi:hypothetical protein